MNKRLIWLLVASGSCVRAESSVRSLVLEIQSAQTLSGVAGDYVTVEAQIRNTGSQPVSDVTTYLSLVNTADKLPVDLEDWSAEKGLFIGTIDAGQVLPLHWKIHFVKPGSYALLIVALTAGQGTPEVSSVVLFQVRPRNSLNPGHVLPVALGTPVVLGSLLLALNYRRRARR